MSFGNILFAIGILALGALANDQELLTQFASWGKQFNREYDSDKEFVYRLSVFNETLARIATRNSLGGATFALNQFSDMTPHEFRTTILMVDVPKKTRDLPVAEAPANFEAPAAFDWRSKNAVTPVKDQGQCGSCWAFSATETIESAWIIAGHPQVILAPQQLVDCDTTDQGCNGGLPEDAFQYIETCGGQETNAEYPYTAQDGTCKFDKSKVAATVSSHQAGTSGNNEQTLQSNLASISPISIAVDASSWQDYSKGVMTAAECNPSQIDHAVQLVGYDSTASTPYWIVRNSWAATWGVDGYIWLEMWKNTCLMATDTSLAKPGPVPATTTTTSSTSSTSSGPTGSPDAQLGGGSEDVSEDFLAA